MPPRETSKERDAAMTRTESSELFKTPTHRHLAKDLLLVMLVAGLTAGFLVHAWRPSERMAPVAAMPATALAQR
jgi:hypothetical protein